MENQTPCNSGEHITLVVLPEDLGIKPLPFYLTLEEWLAKKAPKGNYFFMWQVTPTVIFGRNQQIEKEVNIDYCKSHNIDFYRRKSGGGCVYADMDNIMFSYVTPSTEVQTTFNYYTERVAEMLREIGLDARASGRNDVLIKERKVSGNAFYHIPGRSIVHGTMLFSTDMENMLNAITPSKSKLESKKVQSVASHITTISEHLPDLSIEEFKRKAAEYMTDGVMRLSDKEIQEVEEMSQQYYTDRWIYGQKVFGLHSESRTKTINCRIDGCGELSLEISIDRNGLIDDIDLKGDYFLTGDLDNEVLNHLHGSKIDYDEILPILKKSNLSKTIVGLTAEQLAEIICSK